MPISRAQNNQKREGGQSFAQLGGQSSAQGWGQSHAQRGGQSACPGGGSNLMPSDTLDKIGLHGGFYGRVAGLARWCNKTLTSMELVPFPCPEMEIGLPAPQGGRKP